MLWDPELILSRAQKTYYLKDKPRNSLWWGAKAGYQPLDTSLSIGTSLMFLHKKGIAFEGDVELNTKGRLQYEGGIKWNLPGATKRPPLCSLPC
jgi:hypothetical protein